MEDPPTKLAKGYESLTSFKALEFCFGVLLIQKCTSAKERNGGKKYLANGDNICSVKENVGYVVTPVVTSARPLLSATFPTVYTAGVD